jgi:hypothetical protein
VCWPMAGGDGGGDVGVWCGGGRPQMSGGRERGESARILLNKTGKQREIVAVVSLVMSLCQRFCVEENEREREIDEW